MSKIMRLLLVCAIVITIFFIIGGIKDSIDKRDAQNEKNVTQNDYNKAINDAYRKGYYYALDSVKRNTPKIETNNEPEKTPNVWDSFETGLSRGVVVKFHPYGSEDYHLKEPTEEEYGVVLIKRDDGTSTLDVISHNYYILIEPNDIIK